MSQRRFLNIGRFLVAACAVSLGAASLQAQSAPAAPAMGSGPSRWDVFMGYSYMGAHGIVKPQGYRFSSVDEGAVLSVAYYFNKYAGAEILGFANPDGQNDGFYAGYAGPIFRAPMHDFTLFAHGLVGGVRGGGPNNNTPGFYEHEFYTWGPGLVAGGGMDYDLPWFNHRFGLRLFEADYRYIHLDYGPVNTVNPNPAGGRVNLSAVELSTGILMHFGHIIPPPPVTYSCSVTTPTGTVYPGDQVTVTGTVTNIPEKKNATYSWSSDAVQGVSSTSSTVTVDTKTLSSGTYTVKGHAGYGSKPGQFADCSATITVANFEPPTVGCSANPSTVNPGDPSTITANGVSPQNRPLTYSYSATAGSISGNTSTATLQTTGVAPGTITVTCNVVDDKGQTASQTTTVTVAAPPAPPQVMTKSLCNISFDSDAHRPSRVNNEAKACLDDIALDAQRDPQAKLAVVGNSATDEKDAQHKAAERAVNEKAYLVNDKGMDASRIAVYTGNTGTKSAGTIIIPAGATLDMTGLTPVDETAVMAIPRNAPAHMARHHRKHKK